MNNLTSFASIQHTNHLGEKERSYTKWHNKPQKRALSRLIDITCVCVVLVLSVVSVSCHFSLFLFHFGSVSVDEKTDTFCWLKNKQYTLTTPQTKTASSNLSKRRIGLMESMCEWLDGKMRWRDEKLVRKSGIIAEMGAREGITTIKWSTMMMNLSHLHFCVFCSSSYLPLSFSKWLQYIGRALKFTAWSPIFFLYPFSLR